MSGGDLAAITTAAPDEPDAYRLGDAADQGQDVHWPSTMKWVAMAPPLNFEL